ncbi:PEP-CTERM sorting domain-containing protein [Candidatus Poribacteria bacterium]|nr:PEP-CTERM sorting domain-containing protein [Candidatus Poribacteria bacterium]
MDLGVCSHLAAPKIKSADNSNLSKGDAKVLTCKAGIALATLAITSLCFTLLQPEVSSAAVITFTDPASFQAALKPGSQTEDFSSLGLPNSDVQIPDDTVFDVGLFNVFYTTFAGVNESFNDIKNAGDGTINGTNELRLSIDITGDDKTQLLELRFDSPITAFGADWNGIDVGDKLTLNVGADSIVLEANLGSAPGSFNIPTGDGGFLGFTSDTAFTSVNFTATITIGVTETWRMDNVVLGNVIPEPNTIALFLMGLSGMAIVGWRRRKRAA